jgi:hypothetical protein
MESSADGRIQEGAQVIPVINTNRESLLDTLRSTLIALTETVTIAAQLVSCWLPGKS